MKRLVDERSDDPLLQRGAVLVRSATSTEPTAASRERVWRALPRTRHRRATLGLRPAFALGLLLFGAFAGASIWRGWRRAHPTPVSAPAPERNDGARRAVRSSGTIAPAVTPELAPTVAPTIAPSVAPSLVAPAPSPPPIVAPRPARRSTSAPPTASPDAALLLERAVRALRHEHDAARAAALADEFLTRFPHDELVEEGLAVAIAAHDRLGDDRAVALAERYLSRYPQGSFRSEALRIRGAE